MKIENHQCAETEVEVWVGRHFEPKEYAVENSSLHPKRAPEQAVGVIQGVKTDLTEIASQRDVRLRLGTSVLSRAIQSMGLVLDNIEPWLRNGGPKNIQIEDLEIMDFLETTQGPAGLIKESRWLPEVRNITNRRKMAYLSWLLDIPEVKLREWGLETPSDVEYNTMQQFRDMYSLFQNNFPDKTIIYGTSHEPLYGALLKRHTHKKLNLTPGFGERIKGCMGPEGVVLHWRDQPAMLTKWGDVLTNNPRMEQTP